MGMSSIDDPYGLKEILAHAEAEHLKKYPNGMPKKRQAPIPQGAIFTATSGEYSDFSIRGVFRALKEIDVDKTMEIYQKHRTKREGISNGPDKDEVLAYLVRAEYIEQLEAWELYFGSYGDFRADVNRFNPSDRIIMRNQKV
jgi:hypothetical protein